MAIDEHLTEHARGAIGCCGTASINLRTGPP